MIDPLVNWGLSFFKFVGGTCFAGQIVFRSCLAIAYISFRPWRDWPGRTEEAIWFVENTINIYIIYIFYIPIRVEIFRLDLIKRKNIRMERKIVWDSDNLESDLLVACTKANTVFKWLTLRLGL